MVVIFRFYCIIWCIGEELSEQGDNNSPGNTVNNAPEEVWRLMFWDA